ncbi:hypothetical protein BDN72DRAFT_905401 [Pluteus cervinus]|uniref:Uncharacterized protein n=1 Tax=Pluteus cervinus TaxID=181527 RepID=A0ACD3A3S5_9AGAR|nr:hypothetical protein BDN72DRAFT_905401 [Pluteus cervinus]
MDLGYPDFSFNISNGPRQHRCSLRFPAKNFSGDELDDLCQFLSFRRLQTLSTNILPSYVVENHLQNSADLQSIKFHGQVPWDFSWALGTGSNTFSAFKELVICGIEKDIAPQLRNLREALADCRVGGLRLARLVFVNCPTADAGQFKDVVDVVSVEG